MNQRNKFIKDEDKSGVQYQFGTYITTSGAARTKIHIFTTKTRSSQRLVPIISLSKASLSGMNPNPSVAAATSVIAKINGNVYDAGPIGINYEGVKGNLYISDNQFKTAPAYSDSYTRPTYSPAFCVKKDGNATIRWFSNADELQKAMNACDCIIAAAHALVFGGECIMEKTIYAKAGDKLPIYEVGGGESQDSRYDFSVNKSNPEETLGLGSRRTCLGHISNSYGKYVLVCADGNDMTIWDAAHLMQSLGCDYAVNLDGAISTQMRIKNGYGANGQVTDLGNRVYAGVAVYSV